MNLMDRAAQAWIEHAATVEREEEQRRLRERDTLATEAELAAMAALGVANTDVTIGQFTPTHRGGEYFTQATIEVRVGGMPFMYVKQQGYGFSAGTGLHLVQMCPKCGGVDLAVVRFLWQLGEALANGAHPDGCARLTQEKAAGERTITGSEVRFLDGLVGVLRERGLMRDDDAPIA